MKKNIKIIFAYVFLFIIIFSFLGNNCKADINTDYGNNTEVNTVDLDKKVENDDLWEVIAQLIYAVGNVIENLVGNVMGMLTGSSVFPWADKIIFNTVPMLDINFINPSNGSMFKSSSGQEQILSKLVKNVYYTVLSLAVGFLGVAVGIMAVRLVISTIASEKAKYKQAIFNWFFGILMLFTMHFTLSFLFYINEQMVVIASNILKNSLDNIKNDIPSLNNIEYYQGIVYEFFIEQFSVVKNAGSDISEFNGCQSSENTPGEREDKQKNFDTFTCFIELVKLLGGTEGDAKQILAEELNAFITTPSMENLKIKNDETYGNNDKSIFKNKRMVLMVGKLLDNSTYVNTQLYWASGNHSGSNTSYDSGSAIRTLYNDMYLLSEYKNNIPKGDNEEQNKIHDILEKIYKNTPDSVNDDFSEKTQLLELINDMGSYFRETAWTYETDDAGKQTGWNRNQVTIVGATLYSIFIIQSLMYFIQYIKRFFYIIILSLIGPAVVIYDFVTKSIK